MITLRKLSSLKHGTRLRKAADIFYMAARNLESGNTPDLRYLAGICALLLEDPENTEIAGQLREKSSCLTSGNDTVRCLDSLYYILQGFSGTTPADWDLNYKSAELKTRVLPGALYLDDIRSPFNVGAVFRTAAYFGLEKIFLSHDCPSPEHKRSRRTAMGTADLISWEYRDLKNIEGEIFALELGGTEISEFVFPEKGTMIIGSEELGISAAAKTAAEESFGILSIPGYGRKGSLNLSVAAGIAMHWWSMAVFK
jgi:RNA methyltransferase, TrmH family